MKLNHLKWNACPTCGARVVSETQRSRHTNGQWFEKQEFECGCSIEFIPNFSREEVKTECPKSAEGVSFREKRESARKKLFRYIDRLDVDEDFKHTVGMWIPSA